MHAQLGDAEGCCAANRCLPGHSAISIGVDSNACALHDCAAPELLSERLPGVVVLTAAAS